jgi:hypothetical protein
MMDIFVNSESIGKIRPIAFENSRDPYPKDVIETAFFALAFSTEKPLCNPEK